MDPKSDDSGSDTLDQSLQKKCVVADDDSSSSSSTSKKQPDAAVSEKYAANAPTTEPGGINMSEPKDSPASPSPPPPTTPTPQQLQPPQQPPPAAQSSQQSTHSSTSTNSSPRAIISENNIQKYVVVVDSAANSNNGDLINDAGALNIAKTADNNSTTSINSNVMSNNKEDSRGFESKVRQISDDLKDTTLADENSLEKLDGQQKSDSSALGITKKDKEDKDKDKEKETPLVADGQTTTAATAGASTTASATSGATTTTTCLVDIKNDSDGYDSDRTITYESPSKKSSNSSSSDKKKLKKITKKVRFKYNQHGKVCPDEGDDEDDDDDDDEDDDEDDDDEDTLNEGGRSKSLLDPSQFPLSFESPHDEDEDNVNEDVGAQQLAGEADEAVEDPPPEGGVQNILGKVSQMGKIEYLLRWVNKPGVQWENEEVLKEICPNLIKLYEEQRAKEREQDMHFAVRRKKTRQGLRNV